MKTLTKDQAKKALTQLYAVIESKTVDSKLNFIKHDSAYMALPDYLDKSEVKPEEKKKEA